MREGIPWRLQFHTRLPLARAPTRKGQGPVRGDWTPGDFHFVFVLMFSVAPLGTAASCLRSCITLCVVCCVHHLLHREGAPTRCKWSVRFILFQGVMLYLYPSPLSPLNHSPVPAVKCKSCWCFLPLSPSSMCLSAVYYFYTPNTYVVPHFLKKQARRLRDRCSKRGKAEP